MTGVRAFLTILSLTCATVSHVDAGFAYPPTSPPQPGICGNSVGELGDVGHGYNFCGSGFTLLYTVDREYHPEYADSVLQYQNFRGNASLCYNISGPCAGTPATGYAFDGSAKCEIWTQPDCGAQGGFSEYLINTYEHKNPFQSISKGSAPVLSYKCTPF